MSIETVLAREVSSRPPLVSVVIPLYNGGRWIDETLNSVLNQAIDAPWFEIIVVDDGSSDDGTSVAARLLARAQINSRVLRAQNGGPSQARNIGWRSGRGHWIQFLDADDLVDPAKLRIQLATCELEPQSTAVVYSDWTRLEEVGREWRPRAPFCRPRVSDNTLESLLRAEHFLQLGCTLVRRKWLEAVGGFCEDQRIIEDVNLFIRIALAGGAFRHVATASPVLYYRQHDTSLSRQHDDLFAEGCYKNAKLVESYWRLRGQLDASRRTLLAQIYIFSSRLAAPSAPQAARRMLNGVSTLALPAAVSSAAARRAVVRAVTYQSLGHGLASRLEHMYTRISARSRAAVATANA